MKGERNAGSVWLVRSPVLISAAVIACCCGMLFGCKKKTPEPTAAPRANVQNPASHELRTIGERTLIALLARDTKTLLEYDHNAEDEASLNNKSSELYCYLFDTSCIPDAKKPAVYEIVSSAPKVGIDASVATVQGRSYGLLMFYDKSQVSSDELYSPDFLCSDKALKATASWHFILDNEKWITTTLFDYKIGRSCKQ
jgi:hypothetical protein